MPIQMLRLRALPFCGWLIIPPVRNCPNASRTREKPKGWSCSLSRAPGRAARARIRSTICAGGVASGTPSRAVKSRFSSSKRARAAGSAARVRSSSRACGSFASPSRTACISSSISRVVMSGGPQVWEQLAQAPARREEPRFHRLLRDAEDRAHLAIAAVGEVAQREHGAIVHVHADERLLDAIGELGLVGVPRRVGIAVRRDLGLVIERLLAAALAREVERLVERDAVDPAEELVA